jgi:hypothetical protein
MSMDRVWRISFTVYLDDALMESRSDLTDLTTTVTAFMPQQAEAMLRAQYQNRVRIWSIVQA